MVAEGKGVVHCRIMCDDYMYLVHVAKELLRLAPRDNRCVYTPPPSLLSFVSLYSVHAQNFLKFNWFFWQVRIYLLAA